MWLLSRGDNLLILVRLDLGRPVVVDSGGLCLLVEVVVSTGEVVKNLYIIVTVNAA